MPWARITFLMFLLSALLCSGMDGQTAMSGALCGSLRDAGGALLQAAVVTAEDVETGERFTVSTDERGEFRYLDMEPGQYTLHARAIGFVGPDLARVSVEVGRTTRVDIDMAIPMRRESVEVRDGLPAVNTQQPDFASNVNDAELNQLPINGRRWSNIALLTPSTTLDGDYGLISFRGISGLLNNSTVDGADNNQAFFSEERGRTRISYVISQASVREFQVNTSNFSAEYGRAAGSVVNSVTRSGTGHFKGEAFYYDRDSQLGATNAYTTLAVKDAAGNWTTRAIKPLDRRQQFGGAVGGPLPGGKAFYFASVDLHRRDFPAVAAANNPARLFGKPCVISSHWAGMSTTNQALVQVCSYDELYTLTRNVMPLYSTDAQAIAAFNAGISYLDGLLGEAPRTSRHEIYFGKLDYHLTQRHGVSLSYNRLRWSSPGGVQSEPVVNLGVRSFGNDGVKVDMLTARLSSVFSNHFISQLRAAWGRDFEYQTPQRPAAGEPVGALGYAPAVSVVSGSSGFSFGTPASIPRRALPDEHRTEVAETASWMHGQHVVKLGADFNAVEDRMDNLYAAQGSYNFSYRDNFIAALYQWQNPIGTQYQGYSSYVQSFGTAAFRFNTYDVAVFAQDEWRVARRLVLNLGVRYENEMLPAAQRKNPLLAASQSFPQDGNNLAPRFGFAWDVFGDGRTALRGGYGIFYGRINNSTLSSAITNTGTAAAQRRYSFKACYLYAVGCLNGPVFPAASAADPYSASSEGSVAVFDRHMQAPQVHQADLILEQQLAPNTLLSVSGLLGLGRQLPNFVDINLDPATRRYVQYTFAADYYTGAQGPFYGHTLAVPVYTARLNANFQTITNIVSNVNSSFAALVVQLSRHVREGLGIRVNYTLSHALDDGQTSTTFTTYNNTLNAGPLVYYYDGQAVTLKRPDYGTSNYDVRHRVTASVRWSPRVLRGRHGVAHQALNGWTLAPVVQFHTGRPYSETVGGDAPITTCAGCFGYLGSGGPQRLPFVGRNSYRYAGFYNVDLRLQRHVKLGEHSSVELLAEAFNLFNHRNVSRRITTQYTVYGTTLEYDSNFGRPTAAANTVYRERELQVGARVHF